MSGSAAQLPYVTPGLGSQAVPGKQTLIPSVHLAKMKASATPTVLCVGDSTWTWGANLLALQDSPWAKLQARMKEDNPTKTFTFVNNAVGGTTMSNWLTNCPGNVNYTFFNPNINWNAYNQAVNPTTVFIVFGVNDTYLLTAYFIQSVLNNIVSWGTQPASWQASHTYSVNTIITDSNGRLQVCSVAGTSAASHPTWPTTVNSTVTDGGTLTWQTLSSSVYVPSIPDIVFVTNKVANINAGTPYSSPTYQAGYLSAQSIQRTLYGSNGGGLNVTSQPRIGLIDVGRYFDMAVLGFDPVNPYLQQTITGTPPTITTSPYNLTSTSGDFDIQLSCPGQASAMNTATTQFVLSWGSDGTTSSPASDTLAIQVISGETYVTFYPSGAASTGVALGGIWGTGSVTIQVTKKAEVLTVVVNGATIMQQSFTMFSGPASPTLSINNPPSGGFSVIIESYSISVSRQNNPWISNLNAYGPLSSGTVYDGNGINHDASPALNGVDAMVLDATAF